MDQANYITFVIIARDEAGRIEYLLRNLKGFGRIILMLDDRTTDTTRTIAERYGAEIHAFTHTGWTEGEETVDKILSLVKTEWVYWAYVDELLAKPLLHKMVEIAKTDKYRAVWMRRKNYHYGGVNLQNGQTMRFFKKGAIDFKGNRLGHFGKIVAEPQQVLTLPLRDEYSIHHFSTYNVNKFEVGHNAYSNIEAKENIEGGRHFSLARLIGKPIYYFLRYIFVGGAWRWGTRGLIIAANYAFYFFNIEAKMWEIENKVSLESIENTYSELKEKLIKE